MDEDTLNQFNEICKKLRALIYSIKSPEMVLLDLDSTKIIKTFLCILEAIAVLQHQIYLDNVNAMVFPMPSG